MMKPFLVLVFLAVFFTPKCIKATTTADSSGNWLMVVSDIQIWGNKVTKNWIIYRELNFALGDTLTKFQLLNRFESSKINLTNTSLFTVLDIRFVLKDSIHAEVFVMVKERWYLWPIPIFELAETNFNSWWENKDFSRINYGIDLRRNNFRGRQEKINLILQFGFTEKLSLVYTIPYINKKKTLGLELDLSYGQNHEINYTSDNNKRVFYKDFYRVQQAHRSAGFNIRYRKKFYNTHIFGSSYNDIGISDSVIAYNPNYLKPNQKNMKYLTLSYKYILDKRDNNNYALQGYYVSGTLIKYGLGVFDSASDLWWNKIEYKHYWKLGHKTYLAAMGQVHYYLNDNQPYYFRDGLGYTDKSTVRSYELYVIDAQQMGTAKVQWRYQLIAPKKYETTLVPVNRFKSIYYSLYFGVFGDVGYAHDQQRYMNNTLADDVQYGSGVSLDLATYYDIVFRAEYSMNKFGEHGLFLHFVAPI